MNIFSLLKNVSICSILLAPSAHGMHAEANQMHFLTRLQPAIDYMQYHAIAAAATAATAALPQPSLHIDSSAATTKRPASRKRTRDDKNLDNTPAAKRHKRVQQQIASFNRNIASQRFVCQRCGQPCRSRSELIRHEDRHKAVRTHGCPIQGCTYSASQPNWLYKHIRHTHNENNQAETIIKQLREQNKRPTKQVICRYCPADFKTLVRLAQHTKSIHGTDEQRMNFARQRAAHLKKISQRDALLIQTQEQDLLLA